MERLKKMGPFSPEYSVIRSYIELVTELPWCVSSTETIDVQKARKVRKLCFSDTHKHICENIEALYILK